MLKMIMLMSCEFAFYKLNISDANFTDKRHLVESNFKGINLRKLREKALLIKCILTPDNVSRTYWNRYKDIWPTELFQL